MNKRPFVFAVLMLALASVVASYAATPPQNPMTGERIITDGGGPLPPNATVGNVWTTDVNGNIKLQFNLGETVYVHWSANGIVNIVANGPSGFDQQWLGQSGNPGAPITYTPAQGVGYYSITCTGAETKMIAYGTIFVVPQLPMGILAAIGACFTAFGIMKFRQARRL